MMTSRTRLPQKESRTRTHAITVPTTTLTAVTRAACPTVKVMAAQVCSLLTTDQ